MMSSRKNPFLSLIDAVQPALEADEKHYAKWERLHKERASLSIHHPPWQRYDMADHIIKRGHFRKGWRKRWFVLRGSYLYYYSKCKEGSKFLGVILMRNCSIVILGEHEKHPNVIEIMPRTPRHPGMKMEDKASRKFFLSFPSQVDMSAWLELFSYKAASVSDSRAKSIPSSSPSTDGVLAIVHNRRKTRAAKLGLHSHSEVSLRDSGDGLRLDRAVPPMSGESSSVPRASASLPRSAMMSDRLRSTTSDDVPTTHGMSMGGDSLVVHSTSPPTFDDKEMRRRYLESVLGDTVAVHMATDGRSGISGIFFDSS